MNNRRWLGGLLGAGIVAAAVAGMVTARAGAAQPASGSLDASLGGRVVVFPAADRDTAAGGSSATGTIAQDAAGTAGTAQDPPADPSSLTGTFVRRLAQALDLPRERVDAAIREVLSGMVDEAARNGRLSSEQAAALRQRIAQGQYRLVPPMGVPGHGWGGKHRPGGPFLREGQPARLGGLLQALSDTLDLTPGQILDRLWQGKTLAQIAEEQGVSRQQVTDAIIGPAKRRLDAAVAAGRLTPQQASQRLERLKERGNALLDRKFTPPGAARNDEAGASRSAASGDAGSARGEPAASVRGTTGTAPVVPPDGGEGFGAGAM